MADREMKNEEAIEILGGIRACYNIFDEYDEPKYAALSKAIFALKAEPTFEQIEGYCRKRCLVVVDGALFNEMKSRWSAEPKHGRWSKEMVCCEDENGYFHFGYQCSQCKAILNKTKRCGECGAIMDEVEE